MDKKGIITFCVITIGGSCVLEGITLVSGTSRVLPYLVLVIPALAAWIASYVSPRADYPAGGFWPIPKVPVLRMALVAPVVFALAYAIGAASGLLHADWSLTSLMITLPPAGELGVPPEMAPTLPMMYFAMGTALALVLGPTIYALMMVLNEYGWRGYLLARLMPLGRWPAYLLSSLLWAVSLVPLVIQRAGGVPSIDIPVTLGMALTLGVVLARVKDRSKHIGLTAVCAGCLICQASSMWVYLFPALTVRFPWTGPYEIVALIVWGIAAIIPGLLFGRLEPKSTSPAAPKI